MRFDALYLLYHKVIENKLVLFAVARMLCNSEVMIPGKLSFLNIGKNKTLKTFPNIPNLKEFVLNHHAFS